MTGWQAYLYIIIVLVVSESLVQTEELNGGSADKLSEQNKTCNILELEAVAIGKITQNLAELYYTFYSPNLPEPESVMVQYITNSGEALKLKEGNCREEQETWFWMSSAVYFIIDPTVLNTHALYIIGLMPAFYKSLQREVNITLPPLQEECAFNLVQQFTMGLKNYAYKTPNNRRIKLGFVLRRCNNSQIATMFNNGQDMQTLSLVLISLLAISIYVFSILQFIIQASFAKRNLPHVAMRSKKSSYRTYGLIWGITMTSVSFNILVVYSDIHSIADMAARMEAFPILLTVAELFFIIWIISGNFILAVVLGRKHHITTPKILQMLTKVVCCGYTKYIASLLTICCLWTNLLSLQLIMAHSVFIFLALLAAPEEVICKTLLIVFSLFCTVHLLAVLFTAGKIQRTDKKSSLRTLKSIGVGMLFSLLFVGLLCFGFFITTSGELDAFGTNEDSTLPSFTRFISPLLLSGAGWGVKIITIKWLTEVEEENSVEKNTKTIKWKPSKIFQSKSELKQSLLKDPEKCIREDNY